MKKFKSIIKNLQEAGAQSFGGSVFNGFSDPAPRSALSDKGLHYAFKDPEQLARLNAFTNSFLGGTYLDPKEPLKELAGRIGQLGLSMKFDNNVKLAVGENHIPLAVFGDKFGVTPTTDLSQGFDTGEDYPDMLLCFTLLQTKTGYVFTDIYVKSQICTDCPQEVGSETDNTHAAQTAEVPVTTQNEETITLNQIQEFLEENELVQSKIMLPIYESLEKSINRNEYSKEKAFSRFIYAINSGLATLENPPAITEEQKSAIATNMLSTFETDYQG